MVNTKLISKILLSLLTLSVATHEVFAMEEQAPQASTSHSGDKRLREENREENRSDEESKRQKSSDKGKEVAQDQQQELCMPESQAIVQAAAEMSQVIASVFNPIDYPTLTQFIQLLSQSVATLQNASEELRTPQLLTFGLMLIQHSAQESTNSNLLKKLCSVEEQLDCQINRLQNEKVAVANELQTQIRNLHKANGQKDELAAEKTTLTKQVTAASGQIQLLESNIINMREESEKQSTQITKLEDRKKALKDLNQNLTENKEALQQEAERLKKEIEKKEKQLKSKDQLFSVTLKSIEPVGAFAVLTSLCGATTAAAVTLPVAAFAWAPECIKSPFAKIFHAMLGRYLQQQS